MNEQESYKKFITKEQARTKAERFCAYQERAQQEVREKLYSLGLHSRDTEEVIAELIENNFLNEERFALAYAQGKFRMKRWGKLKIKQGLKQKQVPAKLVEKALKCIDQDEYYSALVQLLKKKSDFLSEKDEFKRNFKLLQYAAGKGFEKNLILEILKDNHLDE